MEADVIGPADLFRAVMASGARALLIGRRALVTLGIPVMTADYDYWIHIDDIEMFNGAFEPLGFVPNRTPEEARARGRYVLEGGEQIEVLVARSATSPEGHTVGFDDAWARSVSSGPRRVVIDPEALAAARASRFRLVSAEEIREALETPLSEAELERIDELRTWFLRRYPTVAARHRYVSRGTRAYSRFVDGLRAR